MKGRTGRGSLYRRGTTWWIKYYANGRPYRESTKTDSFTEAKRLLVLRLADAARGHAPDPRMRKLTVGDLLALVGDDYQINGRKSLDRLQDAAAHVSWHFGGQLAMTITPVDITRYILGRQKAGAANSTINRELGALRRGFRLAVQAGMLPSAPPIRMLRERVRTGFFEPEQFMAVRRHLRPDLQVAVDIAYIFGWRIQSEVLTLERRQLNLDVGTLRLEPGTTKNAEGRIVYLPADLKAELLHQVQQVQQLERGTGRIIPYVFPHLTGRYRGQPVRDFRRAWLTACRKAGLPGMLRHDFRRTAVRNMVNAGIPERVAMQVTGHKSRSVFDRYHIVSPNDLQEVARKLTGTIRAQSATRAGEGGM
jgi:integrase